MEALSTLWERVFSAHRPLAPELREREVITAIYSLPMPHGAGMLNAAALTETRAGEWTNSRCIMNDAKPVLQGGLGEMVVANHLVCDSAPPDKGAAVSQAAVGHFHA